MKGGKDALVRALMQGVERAPKKDKPGLLDDAARIAEAGRYGDKIAAHITPEEAALLKARGGSGTINPRTGLMEFFEGSTGADSHGDSSSGMSGADYGGGSAYGGDGGMGGSVGVGADIGGQSGGQIADMSAADINSINMGGLMAGPAEVGLSDFGAVGRGIGSRIDQAVANPAATAINTMAGFALGPVGMANSISGLFGGPTIGGAVTGALGGGAARGGSQTASAAPSASGEGGPLGNDTRGGNGGASGDGGGLSRPNTALANALMGGQQAGSPANPFGGRQTYGALVDSFSPVGKRYVTPWAYRG